VRVRETAVGAFEGKKDSQIAREAVRAALADPDVGVCSNAIGVVAKNGWTEFFDAVRNAPPRFPGCTGADVREAAISAMSDLYDLITQDLVVNPNRTIFEAYLHDPNPGPRAAAEAALAKLGKKDPPKTPTRGADLTGELLPGGAPIFDKDVFLVVETNKGTMKIRLFPDQAPVHCAHVAALARTHFYDGLTWHRVVPDFVIQGGCPRGDGSGNAGVTLPLEPTLIPFERGTLGMPRSDHPDTGGCQLFICHSRAPHLDVRYTAFGKVVEGFDVIDKIDVDDKIVRVTVEGAR
jgi:peptidyl-prolyl cis-trans isomerase B (cyclophilin B)